MDWQDCQVISLRFPSPPEVTDCRQLGVFIMIKNIEDSVMKFIDRIEVRQ